MVFASHISGFTPFFLNLLLFVFQIFCQGLSSRWKGLNVGAFYGAFFSSGENWSFQRDEFL